MTRTQLAHLGYGLILVSALALNCLAQTAAPPTDANGWEKLGTDYLQAGRYADAVVALQKAVDGGFPQQIGKYNLACAFARSGDKQKALDLLESLAAGPGLPGPVAGDPDLASLSGEPRFQKLVALSQRAAEPCKDAQANPQYRQLDFWVGEWDVYSGKQKVGESSVQLILKDCVVFENWSDLQGGTGKSFNKYNNLTKQWEQFWVADSGTTNYFKGSLVDGVMSYTVELPTPSGGKFTRHLTFTPLPEGKVRQLSERSSDGGKTWSTEYDFVYVKKQRG
jgi:tetratricopeptide (TPR) repeat protein